MKFDKIILLDDDKTTLFVNQDAVEEYFPGVEILAFNTSSSFIKKAIESPEWFKKPTLLLLDLNMPDLYGYEVLDELEDEIDDLNKLSVVLVTSSSLKRDIERSTRFDSIVGYIEKPLTKEKIDRIFNFS